MEHRLERELHIARQDGTHVLKLIHGYGSKGVGGVLRDACRARLAQEKNGGKIHDFIAGEDFRISNETTWVLLKRWPELKQDRDLGRGNKGITIAVITCS
jgi:DNA-nicking Smr family endonuclease